MMNIELLFSHAVRLFQEEHPHAQPGEPLVALVIDTGKDVTVQVLSEPDARRRMHLTHRGLGATLDPVPGHPIINRPMAVVCRKLSNRPVWSTNARSIPLPAAPALN